MNIPGLYQLTSECAWVTFPERRAEYSAKILQACQDLPEAALALVPEIQLLLTMESMVPGSADFSPGNIQSALVASGVYNSRIDAFDENDDLFEEFEELPSAVQAVLKEFDDEFMAADEIPCAKRLERLLERLEPYGFTFNYGLAIEPFNLRVIREEEARPTASPALGM